MTDRIAEQQHLARLIDAFLTTMRSLGHGPNRTVVFGIGGHQANDTPPVAGWLLDDPHPSGDCARWLLLEDGHVWHEVVWFAETSDYSNNVEYRWIDRPVPHLVKVLADAVDDARRGGNGFLLGKGGDYHVRDRRRQNDPTHVPERRRSSPGPAAGDRTRPAANGRGIAGDAPA
jgi:hypothetical protein